MPKGRFKFVINRLRMSLDYRQYQATHWGIDLTLSLWGRAAKIFFFFLTKAAKIFAPF
ncbi:hypothetical protein Bca4012_092792 [Brassica carinata]